MQIGWRYILPTILSAYRSTLVIGRFAKRCPAKRSLIVWCLCVIFPPLPFSAYRSTLVIGRFTKRYPAKGSLIGWKLGRLMGGCTSCTIWTAWFQCVVWDKTLRMRVEKIVKHRNFDWLIVTFMLHLRNVVRPTTWNTIESGQLTLCYS